MHINVTIIIIRVEIEQARLPAAVRERSPGGNRASRLRRVERNSATHFRADYRTSEIPSRHNNLFQKKKTTTTTTEYR